MRVGYGRINKGLEETFIEAVAKTFRPLWRMRKKFEVSNAGDNILLFAFESDEDIEKVLMGERWAFDRHLVVFQRYVFSD